MLRFYQNFGDLKFEVPASILCRGLEHSCHLIVQRTLSAIDPVRKPAQNYQEQNSHTVPDI